MAVLSKSRIAKMMLKRLLELFDGAKSLKDRVTLRLAPVKLVQPGMKRKRKLQNFTLLNLFLMGGVFYTGMMEV